MLGDLPKARKYYKNALQLSPNDTSILANLLTLLVQSPNDTKRSDLLSIIIQGADINAVIESPELTVLLSIHFWREQDFLKARHYLGLHSQISEEVKLSLKRKQVSFCKGYHSFLSALDEPRDCQEVKFCFHIGDSHCNFSVIYNLVSENIKSNLLDYWRKGFSYQREQ